MAAPFLYVSDPSIYRFRIHVTSRDTHRMQDKYNSIIIMANPVKGNTKQKRKKSKHAKDIIPTQ